jgi:DNA-binding MarR family transcriptional regulator
MRMIRAQKPAAGHGLPGRRVGRGAVDAGVGTAGALGLRMNEIALGVKRTFHGFLRITRRPLASVGLTAARFDLLYAVRAHAWPSGVVESSVEMRQSDIRRALGVTATVVSRMVRSLQRLGVVVRRRESEGDRRQMLVALTATGLETLKAGCRLFD